MVTQSTKDEMLEGMSLLSDDPEESNILFEFEKYAVQVSTLLKSEMPTPFTIAIHGEWGSGKTTLLRLVEKNLRGSSAKTVWFNAWEYERTSVVASLLKHVAQKLDKDGKLTRHIFALATDVALRQSIGMTRNEVKAHFTSSYKATTSVKNDLEQLVGDQKIIIFIDDLDRCSADSVLSMLESIKMFFSVKNVTIVMAIDIAKVERAWELRYNSTVGKTECREHVEKMFPLKLSLPPKSTTDMKDYVKLHAPSLSKTDINFILHNAQFNPRKIKRMLNLLYVILLNMPDAGMSSREVDDNFQAKLKMLIAWIALTLDHPDLARKIQQDPKSLIVASIICNRHKDYDSLLTFLDKVDKNQPQHGGWTTNNAFFYASEITPGVVDLLKDIKREPFSFRIVSHFADQFGIDPNERFQLNNANDFAVFWGLLEIIMDESGLIGV